MTSSPLLLRNMIWLLVKCKYLSDESGNDILNTEDDEKRGILVSLQLMKICFGCKAIDRPQMIRLLSSVTMMGRGFFEADEICQEISGNKWVLH